MSKFTLQVNGKAQAVEADPATPLIFILRNHLGLTGPKLGCGLEQCGACAVLADGEHILSCVRAVSEFENAEIITAEGLHEDDVGHRVQQKFIEEGAAQCGYCTPGIVIATTALLKQNANPDDGQIIEALDEHL
ncbi:MAG: (2Fe-2S)-binding protein, partial [Proteobacteria bacterium]|nr:(2Fe-2S)-binding protein [Pseudomonadota bacterium]